MTVRREKYGKPTLIQPRLAQGTFRVVVTDSYNRRCAVTGERGLPVFEAAHIRPFADGGEHLVENGLLLRSDAHILFDRGYMTVTPEHRVVSNRLNRSARIVEMESYAWRAIYPRQIAPKRSVVAVMAPVTLAGPFPAMRPFPVFAAVVAQPIPFVARLHVPVSALALEPLVAVFAFPFPFIAVAVPHSGLPLIPFIGSRSRYGWCQDKATNQHQSR